MFARFLLPLSLVAILFWGCQNPYKSPTQDDQFRVEILPMPDPIPLNKPFELSISIVPKQAEGKEENLKVEVDATMPGHGHGMNTVPKVFAGEKKGEFLAKGMLFHMPGLWEIKVTITDSKGNSEALFKVRL